MELSSYDQVAIRISSHNLVPSPPLCASVLNALWVNTLPTPPVHKSE